MCEVCDSKGNGWLGWIDIPPPRTGRPTAAWRDLSHPAHAGMPRLASFPPPQFRRLRSIPESRANVTEMQMAVHTGTHIDAPRHFMNDGPAVDGIPLERLYGPGVVWHLEVAPEQVITAAMLRDKQPALRPGDMLALHTGWAEQAGTPGYDQHPCLGAEAAAWLVEQRVKLVAVDFGTPDMAGHLRPADFAFPVHMTLLPRGILICEHLTNHAALAGRRVEFMFNGLNIRESDGTPTRVLARPVED